MSRPPRLLLRVDADQKIGSGHAMRCLALAQAWQDGGGEVFRVGTALPPALEKRFGEERISSTLLTAGLASEADAVRTTEEVRHLRADWLVVDGYQFGGDYQRALADADSHVLINDDFGFIGEHCSDLILDQNLGARADAYRVRENGAQLLLGPRFALLRREFLAARVPREIPPQARRILVTLGGADLENVTLKILEAVSDLDVETVAVVGPANVHGRALEDFARTTGGRIRLERNVTDMPRLMAWADLAVSAGGTTVWELALMGLPHLLVILADNQCDSAAMLATAGVSKNLGWHHALEIETLRSEIANLMLDRETRASMSARGMRLVDGCGARRVVTEMRSRMFTFRAANEEDAPQIFTWANEPATRAASFASEPISWENHVDWFSKKLRDPDCAFLIVLDDEASPIAQVRFDRAGCEATISVSVDARARGQGAGSAIILGACREYFAARPVEKIHAAIKRENQASLRAFANAGFEETSAPGEVAARFTLLRNAK